MDLRRATRILCGLGGYAVGGVVTPALLLWLGGVLPWFAIDRPLVHAGASPAGAAAIDLGLVALFGLQHSLMAAPRVKQAIARRAGSLERTVYVLAASLTLAALMIAWQPLGGTLWDARGTGRTIVLAGWGLGFGAVYAAALWLDHFHLLGLRQAWRGPAAGAAGEPDRLRTGGPYHFVRHPLMTGLLIVFWSAPRMTGGHLVFAIAMTAYLAIGTWFEERKLHRIFGEAYRTYARWTPMLVPRPWPMRARTPRRDRPAPARPRPRVRRPDIDYRDAEPAIWYGDNVVATAMLNAYSILFPPLERFMVDELRGANREVGDPALAARVRSFAGQEEIHAREHGRSLETLTAHGYRVGGLDRVFRFLERRVLRPVIARLNRPYFGTAGAVAVFAGVEHWTATLAETALAHPYPARMYGPMFSLYYWHSAEELEHKSVVADVYRHLGGGYLLRATMFLLATLVFGLLTALGTAAMLLQIPRLQRRRLGWLTYPLRVAYDGVRFFFVEEKMAWFGLRAIAAYLRPGFHPADRDTDALVGRALALSRDAGATVEAA